MAHLTRFARCTVFSLASLWPAAAHAGGPSILEVRLRSNTLLALLSADLKSGPDQCLLLDVTQGQVVKIGSCVASGHKNIVEVTPDSATLDASRTYAVTLLSMVFSDSPKPVPILQGQYQPKTGAVGTKKPACVVSGMQKLFTGRLQEAASADSADLYFSGQTTHSRGQDYQGTYNLKTDLSGLCNTGKIVSRIGPSLNLMGGNDPNGSPDSLNFSFLWNAPVWHGESVLESFHINQTGTLQSTQDFQQRDLIYGLDFLGQIHPKSFFNGAITTQLAPDAGVELGKNLRAIIAEADQRKIARMKVGANYSLAFNINSSWLHDISLDATWARRWPMIPEVTFKANKGGSPAFSAVGIGTGPRDYVKPSLSLNPTKWFGITAAYEYGSLPPKFSFLDSKFTFGLTVKASLAR